MEEETESEKKRKAKAKAPMVQKQRTARPPRPERYTSPVELFPTIALVLAQIQADIQQERILLHPLDHTLLKLSAPFLVLNVILLSVLLRSNLLLLPLTLGSAPNLPNC